MQREKPDVPSLEALDTKIKDAQEKVKQKELSEVSPANHAMKMGMDLVSGATVGTVCGYFLDVWLGTMPLFLLLFFCVGLAAGVRLMMQSSRKHDNDA